MSASDLADRLRAAAAAHGEAFAETNGEDPEWPLWYAGHLHDDVEAVLGREITMSEIVFLLVSAERARNDEDGDWPDFFARHLLAEASG